MNYCFGMGQEIATKEEVQKYQDTINLDYAWGYYNEEVELVSTWMTFPWQAYFRGKLMKFGAVADVTTQPEYRRRGQIRELFLQSLKQMKETGYIMSGLYPFKFPYYEKFGYAIGSEIVYLKCKPSEILLPDNFTLLKIKEIPKKETFKIIAPIRNEFGKKYNFIHFSDEKTWFVRMFEKRDQIFGVYDLDGNLVGYFITKIMKLPTGTWDSSLDIKDVVALTRDAFFTILDYIKRHTDQTNEFRWRVVDKELDFINFSEKYEVKIETKPLVMYRVIDVQKALEIIDYPKEINDSIILLIKDKYAEWNDCHFKLTVNNGKAICQKIDKTDFDMEIDVNTFTQLFIGYKSIEEISFSTSTKVKEAKKKIIDCMFPKKHTMLLVHF